MKLLLGAILVVLSAGVGFYIYTTQAEAERRAEVAESYRLQRFVTHCREVFDRKFVFDSAENQADPEAYKKKISDFYDLKRDQMDLCTAKFTHLTAAPDWFR